MTLEAREVSVSFGGVHALRGVSASLSPGEVCGVIGPNGSGKTTLFNCLTGFVKPSGGSILCEDRVLDDAPAHERISMGIARTFQTPRFDPDASVWSTVACGAFAAHRSSLPLSGFRLPSVIRRERQIDGAVVELIDRFGLSDVAQHPVGSLPLGTVRLVEVARAMVARPRYLLFDEPAAGLTTDEQAVLEREIGSLAAGGVGVLLVEHNFDLVLRVCERIYVLVNGEVLVRDTPDAIASSHIVADAYLGRVGGEEER